MKVILLSLIIVYIASSAYAQSNGIRFENDLNWDELKAKAKEEKKYIFLDAYATWCGPCKLMDDGVYKSEIVGDFINEKFLSVKIQMDTTKNDNERVKKWRNDAHYFQDVYKINAYPSLLFFNPDGLLVHKVTGAMQSTAFLNIAKDALNPHKQYYTLLKMYREGKLPYSDFPKLSISARNLKETFTAKKVSEDYIRNFLLNLNDEKLFTKENLGFILDFSEDTSSSGFKFLLDHKISINSILGRDLVEYKIRQVIANQLIPNEKDKIKEGLNWDLLQKIAEERFGQLGLEAISGKRMNHYLTKSDWNNFGKYYVLYFRHALKRPEYNVNAVTWPLFLKVSDQAVLKFAANEVMSYAIEEWYQNDPAAYDTYANLLYKIGNINEGINWERKALKMSIGTIKEPVYAEALEKMQKGVPTW